MVKAKKFIYHKQFDGLPKETDFKLIEEELPPIKDGEFLVEAIFFSIDPYMRSSVPMIPLGSTYMGTQVAKVIESKNDKYPVGAYVLGEFGWATHTISDGTPPKTPFPSVPRVLPDLGGLPLSITLGVLGTSGITAYFGLLDICQPKSGETVVVTAAAGAVGSVVGQIAKIRGCTVVGIAGTEEKGRWLLKDLKFDRFVNYKDKDFEKKLTEATPKGVDCYFDSVGGEISQMVLNRMNLYGRIALCGGLSWYNDVTTTVAPKNVSSLQHYLLIMKQIRMEGFIATRFKDRYGEAVHQMLEWIKEGKLKFRESVTEGFENLPKTLAGILTGANIGKTIVKV